MAKKIKSKSSKKKSALGFALYIFVLSFVISVLMSLASQSVLSASGLIVSLLILLVIIGIGIFFDIIGVAVTTCNAAPFHSMAAKKNPYAIQALKLLARAPFVATISNDVVGDISGIISGAAVGNVVYAILELYTGISSTLLSVLMSGIVAGITVGGKAVGKELAMSKSKEITLFVAMLLYKLDYIFKLKWIKGRGR